MEYLQYTIITNNGTYKMSFKPYYKWNTFNTEEKKVTEKELREASFKPYYKWNTFNTQVRIKGTGKDVSF